MKRDGAWKWLAWACLLLVVSCSVDARTRWNHGEGILGSAGQALDEPTPPEQPRSFALPKDPIVAGTAAGYLPGAGEVTPDGAFTYTLPIDVPPSRGIRPSLAITYASNRATNGILGVGFALSGTSSIQRCDKTLAIDGVASGISNTSADVFCLDNQRLVSVHGTYGADGTEYRTEDESFTKVVSYGSPQPTSFRAWLKDGRIREYQSVGPLAWPMVKEQDRAGNEVTYKYTEVDPGTNDYLLTRIEYLAYRIDFWYGETGGLNSPSRDDKAVLYTAGVKRVRRRLLWAIQMYGPDMRLWSYQMNYEDSAESGRARLTSVKRCGALKTCQMARQFTWSARQGDWFHEAYGAEEPWLTGASTPIVLDVDGDGKDEVLFDDGDTESHHLLLSTPPGQPPLSAMRPASAESAPFTGVDLLFSKPVDAGGDGKSEIFGYNVATRQYEMYRWNNGFEPTSTTVPQSPDVVPSIFPWPVEAFHFVDVDGDRLADMVKLVDNVVDGWYKPTWIVRRNLPSGDFGNATDTGIADVVFQADAFASVAVDPHGDGRGGLWPKGASHLMYADEAGRFQLEDVPMDPFWAHTEQTQPYVVVDSFMADLNGDGLRDRVRYHATHDPGENPTALTVAWNTGKAFVVQKADDVDWPVDTGYRPPYPALLQPVDIDVDGRDEILASRNDPPEISIAQQMATPENRWFPHWRSTTIATPTTRITALRIGDFNGDGLPDVMYFGQRCTLSPEGPTSQCDLGTKVGSVHVLLQQSTVIDVVTRVSDEGAAEEREEVEYARQWSDAPEAPTCAYPQMCQRRGMPVVRRHAVREQAGASRERFFSYEDPRFDLQGRGFLGFAKLRVWEPQVPRETVTTFDNVTRVGTRYPYAHRPATVTVATPIVPEDADGPAAGLGEETARVERRTVHYEARDLNGGLTQAVFPHDWKSEEWEEEVTVDTQRDVGVHITGIDGPGKSAPRTRLGQTHYDDWGGLDSETTRTVNGVETTVTTTLETRVGDWLLTLPRWQVVTSTAPGGAVSVRTTELVPDGLGRIQQVTIEPNGSADDKETIEYEYDAMGLIRTVTRTAAGVPARRTHIDYDATPWDIAPSRVWDDLGHARWFVVHPGYGVVLGEMDANGVQTAWTYDDLGRPLTRQPDGAAAQKWSYSQLPDGVRIDTSDDTGASAYAELDNVGRPVRVGHLGFDGTMPEAQIEYDLWGRIVRESRPSTNAAAPSWTVHAFDSLGRLLRVVEPDQATTRYEHTFFETTAWDPRTNPSKLVRDVDDRIVKSVSYLGTEELVTTYDYGPFDRLEHVTDPRQNVTTIGYDLRGRRTLLSDPDKGATRYYYTGLGDLRQTDAAGDVTSYERDALGRAYQMTDADGVTQFLWDTAPHGMGQIARTVSPDGTRTDHTYNQYGWPEQVTWTVGGEEFSIDLGYDPQGRVDTVAYPEVPGEAVRFKIQRVYARGYLQTVNDLSDNAATMWSVDSRSDTGELTKGIYGNGTWTERKYDPVSGRLQTVEENDGVTLSLLKYDYHPDGRVKQRTETGGSESPRSEIYEYDSLHRLTSWMLTTADAGKLTEYKYDELGNLTHVLVDTVEQERNDYLDPRPHAVSSNRAGMFHHDARGRLYQAPDKTLTYTNFDLPRTITTAAGTTHFDYDALGARVRKQGPSGTTISIAGLYERREVAGKTQHVFLVSGSDGPVAQVAWSGGGRNVQYLHQDGLGSVTMVTDSSGAALRAYYEPFGKRIQRDGAALPRPIKDLWLGLTGHEHDDDLGLINLGGRIYDPGLKRVLTPDPHVTQPLFGQSHNRYSYALNDPINIVDPTGYDSADGPDCTTCTMFPQPGGDLGTPGGGGPVNRSDGAFHRDVGPDGRDDAAEPPAPPPIVKSDIDGGSFQALAARLSEGATNPGWEMLRGSVGQLGSLALASVKTLALNALSLGGYSTFHVARAMWNGYREDGVAGALNAANPLYQIGRSAADTYLAVDRGDYRAAGAAGTMTGVLSVATVLGAVQGVEAVSAGVAAGEGATIDTSIVRFTQSSVKQTLSTGENINDVVRALQGPGGNALAAGFKPIRIFEQGGVLRTLDNRRLLIFSQAEREVPYVWATAEEVAAEAWKFTATPQQAGGWFIRVK